MNKSAIMFGICVLPTFGVACGEEPLDRAPERKPSPTLGDASRSRIALLDHDLALGSTGDDVAAVHSYLWRYGYFPNEALMQRYPAWRPLVTEAPASPSIFDQRTALAVEKFQANYGIPVTGIVDAKTREIMRTPRCGIPEGIMSSDPSNKYAILDKYWGNTAKWLFKTPIVRDPDMPIRVRDAMRSWSAATSFTFSQISTGTYDISIKWGLLDDDVWGEMSPPNFINDTADITMNSHMRFHYGTGTPPQDGLTGDFQSIILHEVGHAIGLDHSSFDSSVMFPSIGAGVTKRDLTVDDQVGVSSLYDRWQEVDGDVADVSVGANGELWVIARSDQSVWKLDANGWHWTGANASRIGVGVNGWPYVVDGWGGGTIWFRDSNWPEVTAPPGWINPPAWHELPGGGCAKDIGVGADPGPVDAVWVTACGAGDTTIWKFTGSGWTMDQSGGAAENIAVGYDGRPWVRNSAGAVFRYSTNDPWTGSWEHVSSSPPAIDIGVGAGQYPWIAANSSGTAYVLDRQDEWGSAPWRNEWRAVPMTGVGRGYRIAAGPNGEPWLVTSTGLLFRMVK